MRISTVGYTMKQGVKNIGRNKLFSLASVATMAACIFLFGLFFSVILNFNYIVKKAEEGVAITVFFEENLEDSKVEAIGDALRDRDDVLKVTTFRQMRRGIHSRMNIWRIQRSCRGI